MLIVAALGGNALLRRGQPMTAENQRQNIATAVSSLVALIRSGHQLVITHGNGPQIGLIALQASAGPADGAYPLDILGAESEGMIGYLLQQRLMSELGPAFPVVTLLTQTLVDADDPAFADPTKPIGRQYTEAEAQDLERQRKWQFRRDGDAWRRVVASPKPQRLLEAEVIKLLAGKGILVICAGGGGVPVIHGADGYLQGVEAVVDKDATSAMLAQSLGADMLMLLTDVDGVYLDFDSSEPRRLTNITPGQLNIDQFPAGSMRPKLRAAVDFVKATGRRAAIGRLEQAGPLAVGLAGTQFRNG